MIAIPRIAALILSPLPGVSAMILGYQKLAMLLFFSATLLLPSLNLFDVADTPAGLIVWFIALHCVIAASILTSLILKQSKLKQSNTQYRLKAPALMLLCYSGLIFIYTSQFSTWTGYSKSKITHSASIADVSGGSSVIQRTSFDRNKLEAGDIISFTLNGEYLEKRIHAISGDNVTECINLVFINGVANTWVKNDASSQWQTHFQADYAQDCQYSESFKVPNGYLYVLGDQSRNSKDSRIYGLVSTAQVIGKLLYILPERISDFSSEQPLLSVSFSSNS